MSEPRVAIAVATFRRPVGLAGLLASLAVAVGRATEAQVRVVVVDNDLDESARPIAEGASELSVQYVPQPVPGISQTRNAGVAAALDGGCDFIVFVDDDECVDVEWLNELLRVQATTRADLVAGPVHSVLPADAPALIRNSGLFDRAERDDLSELAEAGSGNLLCRIGLFAGREPSEWFQESYSLTGGSDAELTRRLHREGARIVWAAAAEVWEPVPQARISLRWLARRFRRVGAIDYRLGPDSVSKPVRGAFSGMARVLIGAPHLAVRLLLLGKVDAAAFRRVFRGIGYLEAALGGGVAEYRRKART